MLLSVNLAYMQDETNRENAECNQSALARKLGKNETISAAGEYKAAF
jgi:hypothetical protein